MAENQSRKDRYQTMGLLVLRPMTPTRPLNLPPVQHTSLNVLGTTTTYIDRWWMSRGEKNGSRMAPHPSHPNEETNASRSFDRFLAERKNLPICKFLADTRRERGRAVVAVHTLTLLAVAASALSGARFANDASAAPDAVSQIFFATLPACIIAVFPRRDLFPDVPSALWNTYSYQLGSASTKAMPTKA